MSMALFIKELRETWWMGLLALVAVVSIAFDAVGVDLGPDWRIRFLKLRQSPFLANDFAFAIGMTAICLGTALGLWQSISESVMGTWSFLLHRPIGRSQLIATKLAAGMAVLIVGIGLPLLGYLIWALSGAHAAPFEFWMTENTFRFGMVGVVAYLAAFLTGIREARIYLSRLWPVVPALLIIAAQEDSWPLAGWCLILSGIVVFLPAIFFAAEHRDYA